MNRSFFFSLLASGIYLISPNLFAQPDTDGDQYIDIPQAEEIVPLTEIPIPRQADTQTGLWLKLQASGAMAGSRFDQHGQVATTIYQRYLNSFSHPIPEQFETSGGQSSGTTSGNSRH